MATSLTRLEKRREYQQAYYRRNKDKCRVQQYKWAKDNPEVVKKHRKQYMTGPSRNKYLFVISKRRAKRTGLEFNLELSDIVIPQHCPLLGVEIDENSMQNRSTLDRIDSSKGYIKGNVQVISYRANRIKNDATLEELKLIVQNMEKRQ